MVFKATFRCVLVCVHFFMRHRERGPQIYVNGARYKCAISEGAFNVLREELFCSADGRLFQR